MKTFSILIIGLFLLSFGCSTESEMEPTDTSKDVTLEDVLDDVGAKQDLEQQRQCAGLMEADCLSELSCEWYMMQAVSVENDLCVAGAKVDKCAPASGTQAYEVFIDVDTNAAIISPVGGFGDSWGNWEGCDTKEQEVCLCSGCLGQEPGRCDI